MSRLEGVSQQPVPESGDPSLAALKSAISGGAYIICYQRARKRSSLPNERQGTSGAHLAAGHVDEPSFTEKPLVFQGDICDRSAIH